LTFIQAGAEAWRHVNELNEIAKLVVVGISVTAVTIR